MPFSATASKIVQEAFIEILPRREGYSFEAHYSGHFKGYNANISLRGKHIIIKLGTQWKQVSPKIQKGIIQELLIKLFKIKKKTISIELYHNFLRNVHHTIPKDKVDPQLQQTFNIVNEQFFLGLMEQPNLKFSSGTNRLGTYDYGTDTITISEILLEDDELLEYVMYHEMLHKKHKFDEGRHHTKAFREDEKKFGNTQELEKRLENLIKKVKRKRNKGLFW